MKYRKTTKRGRIIFTADIQHRRSRRGVNFWIIIYSNPTVKTEGYIHLPNDWQDQDRTYTAQDIYWEDKYDCRTGRLMAA